MERRSFVSAAGTLGALLLGSESVGAKGQDDQRAARPTPKTKTVIHLSSGETMDQKHALHNAKNLLEDESVPVNDLVFLANGKGVLVYTPPTDDNEFADIVAMLQERGVTFRACENAMEHLGLTEDDLLPGVEPVPSGVGELARLQQLGYGYIKSP
ncbi:DsrE family protein [Haladaptatus sp. NG-WS-4]